MLAEEIEDADRRARRDLGPGQLIGIAGGETKWKRDVVSVEQDRGFVDEHMTGIEAVFSSHTPVSGHQTMLALDCPISVKEPRRYVFQQRMGLAIADINEDYALDFRSEEHTSELQSLMRISYAVFCLKKKKISN